MPGAQLREWLAERDINDSSLDAPPLRETVVSTVKPGAGTTDQESETVIRKLSDHPAITKQWELYVENEWWPWAMEDRRLSSVQTIYNELFAVYQKQKRLGEAFEVVIGVGLLTWRPPHGPEVKRHVVVAQASVELDESTGVISVDAAADGARLALEQEMLEPQDRPHPEFQNAIARGVEETGDELWSTPKLTTLITTYFQQLSPEGTLDLRLTPQDRVLDRAKPQMHLAPALIVRRRNDRNLLRVFQEISAQLSAGGVIPLGVQRLVEIRDDRAGGLDTGQEDGAASPVVGELYLPLPINDAQQQIVQRLETRQGVLVQGPPGTGKSHTIVNLVCHLLATGRRILITSHTARALRVLKGFITTHAADVAPLCVSLLGDDSQAVHELEDSVQGILGRMHSWDSDHNRSEIHSLQKDLEETRRELAQAFSELRQTRSSEAEKANLGFGGYTGTPQAIAERIADEKQRLGWLLSFGPGGDPPPLTSDDAIELLSLIRKFNAGSDSQPHRQLPDPALMLSPEQFEALVRRERTLKLQLDQSGVRSHPSFAQLARSEVSARASIKGALRQYLRDIDQLAVLPDAWLQRAVRDVASERHGIWQHLHDTTLQRCGQIEAKVAQVSEFRIAGLEGHDLSTLAADASALKEHIDSGGSLGFSLQVNPFAPKHVKAALYVARTVRVNGRLCATTGALAQLQDWIHVTTTLDHIETEWAEMDWTCPHF